MVIKDLLMPIIVAVCIAAGAITIDRLLVRGYGNIKKTASKACDLKSTMRQLWADHVMWMRGYIVSMSSNALNRKEIAERLVKNQMDLGDLMGQYYGVDDGNEYTILLKDHIEMVEELVAAIVAKNQEKSRDADAKCRRNVEKMAHFLQKINTHWTVKEVLASFNDHLNLTIVEITACLNKDWKKDIKAFDDVFEQSMKIADMFTKGIIEQSPANF